jgi:hypothetical protein
MLGIFSLDENPLLCMRGLQIVVEEVCDCFVSKIEYGERKKRKL